MRHQHIRIDAPQIEALAARQHRHRNLADFGGGEHELGVLRRLLQRLEEGVERLLRQHVDFVDDVDLVARARGRIAHAVGDLAHVVDAGMGGGVHFQHVDVPAFHDGLAVQARRRHVDGRPLDRTVRQFVIQRPRQDARGGGFAHTADAGQNPGLRNAPGLERVRDRPDHRFLADQILECRGAVFARQHPIAAAGTRCALAVRRAVRIGSGMSSISHRTVRVSLWSQLLQRAALRRKFTAFSGEVETSSPKTAVLREFK